MKLADFRDKLDTFIQDWTSEQANGEIKMQSHNCDITLRFFDVDGNELEDKIGRAHV